MQRSGNREKLFVGILFVLTWLYLWLRAIYVPLVHDEAATFFIYIQSGRFLPFHSYPDANNHLLNSALSTLSFRIFGGSSLALRLPNLLLWPVYYFSSWALLTRMDKRLMRWIFFLGLVMAHNAVEFFGLCRGYGMSMGLLMAALLLLVRSVESKRLADTAGCLLLMLLALSANLTLVNTTLLTICILLINIVFDNISWRKRLIAIITVIIISFSGLYILLRWMFFLKKSGLLYYHSVTGFFDATPVTLGKMISGTESLLPAWLLCMMFIIVCVLMVIHGLGRSLLQRQAGLVTALLLLGNVVALPIGNLVFGVYYPEDRTALFLFPLLLLSLAFLTSKPPSAFISGIRYIVAVILLYFPLQYVYSVNTSHSSLWYQEGIPARFYDHILKKTRESGRIPSVAGYMLRRFCWSYLNFSRGGELPLVKTSAYPDMSADYQIVHMNKDYPWLYYYRRADYDLSSGLSLLERKQLQQRSEIYRMQGQGGETRSEYFGFFDGSLDTLKAQNLFVEVSFELTSAESPFPGAVVAAVNDSKGNTVVTESLELNAYRLRWLTGQDRFRQGMLLSSLPPDASRLIVYLVNPDKRAIELRNPGLVVSAEQ